MQYYQLVLSYILLVLSLVHVLFLSYILTNHNHIYKTLSLIPLKFALIKPSLIFLPFQQLVQLQNH